MAEQPMIETTNWEGKKVKVLGETFEPGMPSQPDRWENKLRNREEMLKYIVSCERYFYGKEGFGSEKRKNPA